MGRILFLGVVAAFALSLAASGVFLLASRANYPGGDALDTLHALHAEWAPTAAEDSRFARWGPLALPRGSLPLCQ
eukprot:2214272-Pyramimonas_sp.AAC.1